VRGTTVVGRVVKHHGSIDDRASVVRVTKLTPGSACNPYAAEGLGTKRGGLHPVQAALAHAHGGAPVQVMNPADP
jgi:xanthine dehydrogenase iron-sulfur cluster and FAD-binding subunit A